MSNLTSIASESSPQGLQMDTSTAPQSSETFASSYSPVPLNNTEDLSMWLAGDSHASPSRSQDSKKPEMTSATCGPPRSMYFAQYDHDSRSWRTCQDSLLPDISTPSCLDWPRQGLMRNGVCWGLTIVALPIVENDFGLWPTPTSQDNAQIAGMGKAEGTKRGTTLGGAVRMWPTPSAHEGRLGYQKRGGGMKGTQESLTTVVVNQAGGPETSLTTLNPAWVEWLQGVPIGWTELESLETCKFQSWLQQHGKS